jgi:HSP20 family protein
LVDVDIGQQRRLKMAITHRTPVNELTSLHSAMDRLFGEMFEAGGAGDRAEMSAYRLPVDITEDERGYVIKAPVPGFKPEDVEVTFSDGVLSINARHKEERQEKEGTYLRREVVYGNFQRQIALPGDVKGENIKASFENGVLSVEVPRAARPQPLRIAVEPRGEQRQTRELQTGQAKR